MNTLRPGDLGEYSGPSFTYTYRLDAKRIVEIGTLVDATLYYLRRKSADETEFSPFLVVKINDHEKSQIRYVEYPLGHRNHNDEEIARDAMAVLVGIHATQLGGRPAPDDGRAYEGIRRIRHELQTGISGPSHRRRRILAEEDMTLGDFYKHVLLLPEDRRREAVQQYVVDPLQFKQGLQAQSANYCLNKSSLIRDVLFQYDHLDGVLSARSFYIKDLCKTIVMFGERHTHLGSCEKVLPGEARGATVSDIVRDLMHALWREDYRDDPPLLCMVEASPYFGGVHDLDNIDVRDRKIPITNRKPLRSTLMQAHMMDPRAAVHVDIRDELLFYVLGRTNSRLVIWMYNEEVDDVEEVYRLALFLTERVHFIVKEFLPFRAVFRLLPLRVQDSVVAILERESLACRNDPILTSFLTTLEHDVGTIKNVRKVASGFFARVMDLYTFCKIVSSTQNVIVVHEGENHAKRLTSLLESQCVIDEKMELTWETFDRRVKDAFLYYRHNNDFVEYARTKDDRILERNELLSVHLKNAENVKFDYSCLPLSNKDDLFAWFMDRIHRGDSLWDIKRYLDKDDDDDEDEDERGEKRRRDSDDGESPREPPKRVKQNPGCTIS